MGGDLDITLNVGRPALCRIVVGHGSLSRSGVIFASRTSGRRAIWISDAKVGAVLGPAVNQVLGGAFERVDAITISAGEAAKTLDGFAQLIERLHALSADRTTTLVAVGGGSVTDTVGFVAACYMRGIPYVCLPTTLTAQVDAAVGGKVAVNTPWAKNLIGAFYHPSAVVVDPAIVEDAPRDVLRAGMAEIIKVATITDRTLFEMVEAGPSEAFAGSARIEEIVGRALMAKLRLLTPDPYENDLDRLLNFGHETAHALEIATDHGVEHGEAVAIGIAAATRIAEARGYLTGHNSHRIMEVLARYELPTHFELPPAAAGRFDAALRQIALVRGGSMRVVLPDGIGSASVSKGVTIEELRGAAAGHFVTSS